MRREEIKMFKEFEVVTRKLQKTMTILQNCDAGLEHNWQFLEFCGYSNELYKYHVEECFQDKSKLMAYNNSYNVIEYLQKYLSSKIQSKFIRVSDESYLNDYTRIQLSNLESLFGKYVYYVATRAKNPNMALEKYFDSKIPISELEQLFIQDKAEYAKLPDYSLDRFISINESKIEKDLFVDPDVMIVATEDSKPVQPVAPSIQVPQQPQVQQPKPAQTTIPFHASTGKSPYDEYVVRYDENLTLVGRRLSIITPEPDGSFNTALYTDPINYNRRMITPNMVPAGLPLEMLTEDLVNFYDTTKKKDNVILSILRIDLQAPDSKVYANYIPLSKEVEMNRNFFDGIAAQVDAFQNRPIDDTQKMYILGTAMRFDPVGYNAFITNRAMTAKFLINHDINQLQYVMPQMNVQQQVVMPQMYNQVVPQQQVVMQQPQVQVAVPQQQVVIQQPQAVAPQQPVAQPVVSQEDKQVLDEAETLTKEIAENLKADENISQKLTDDIFRKDDDDFVYHEGLDTRVNDKRLIVDNNAFGECIVNPKIYHNNDNMAFNDVCSLVVPIVRFTDKTKRYFDKYPKASDTIDYDALAKFCNENIAAELESKMHSITNIDHAVLHCVDDYVKSIGANIDIVNTAFIEKEIIRVFAIAMLQCYQVVIDFNHAYNTNGQNGFYAAMTSLIPTHLRSLTNYNGKISDTNTRKILMEKYNNLINVNSSLFAKYVKSNAILNGVNGAFTPNAKGEHCLLFMDILNRFILVNLDREEVNILKDGNGYIFDNVLNLVDFHTDVTKAA